MRDEYTEDIREWMELHCYDNYDEEDNEEMSDREAYNWQFDQSDFI